MGQSVIGGLVFCVIGLLLCGFPTAMWQLTEKWKSEGAEAPSKQYMTLLRILSGAFIGFGVLLAAGILH